jgi:hypothetical protein
MLMTNGLDVKLPTCYRDVVGKMSANIMCFDNFLYLQSVEKWVIVISHKIPLAEAIMGSSPDSESRRGHVVFYDGYCVLCSKQIDFILSRDILAAFQFESLQSDFAQRALPERGYPIANIKNLSNTVYLQHNDIK